MSDEKKQLRIPIRSVLPGLLLTGVGFLFLLGVGAWLTVREILPVNAVDRWLYGAVFLAAFMGGRLAVRRSTGGTLLPGMATVVLFFLLLWVIGQLACDTARFANGGIWLLAAALSGGLTASILGRGRKKSRTRGKSSRRVNSRGAKSL